MAEDYGSPIVKPATDKRSYKLIKLRNGLEVLLVSDSDVADAPEDSEKDDDKSDDDEPERDAHEQEQRFPFQRSTCMGFGGEDFMSEMKIRLPYHPDEEGIPNGAPTYSRFKKGRKFNRLKQDKTEDSEQEPTNKNAAAAMCVGVGSMVDPPDAPGLAHYLEHMLFMGSAKFPNENEFDKYLSKHGGSSNAYTDQEFTCFHFEVRKKFLRGALERFSQFFISPLAKVESMEREIQAIESEFVQATGNDLIRLAQVQCHTACLSHPFYRFAWGNRKSLHTEPAEQGIDMRAKLLQLFHDHYLAGRMKLVVLGGGSFKTLQRWVVELFGEVKEGGQGRWSQADIHCEACGIWLANRLYRVAATSTEHILSISFPLPCQESAYLTKPQDYCGHLVGHEGQGSLITVLKNKGLAKAIAAGCGPNGLETNSIVYVFSVTIVLTEYGHEHVMEVIGYLFQYLKMIRSKGPEEWVFQEKKTISKMNFEYFDTPSPNKYAVKLASMSCLCHTPVMLEENKTAEFVALAPISLKSENMQLYPEAHIIYGEFAHDLWKPELVIDVLSRLTPANMRVDLLLHDFDRTASDVLIEPWFETPYTVEAIPEDILELWADPPSVDPAFHIPVHNEFIPHNFTVFASKEDVLKNPSCLIDTAALKVWHRCNRRFKTPRISACFSIMFWPASMQITDAILAELYLITLKHQLSETMYLADSANLHASIYLSGYRIELRIFGFSDKLPLLAGKLANHMKGFTSTQVEFEAVVKSVSESYRTAHEKPIGHAMYLLRQVLSSRFWDVNHKSECLPSITFEDFTKFITNFFSRTYIECFIDGNAQRKDAVARAKIFKEALVSRPLPPPARPKSCIVELPAGTSLLYKVNCRCEFEKNSVVQSYFQIGQDQGKDSRKDSIMLRCFTALFEDIISEPYFDQLRTKEQLGYVVECGCHEFRGVLGIRFMVQSAKYSPQYLEGRINAFIKQIPQILRSMKKEEFQCHKESVIAEKQGMPCSLFDESELFWGEIWNHRYLFDARNHEAAHLVSVTKQDLIDWCRCFLGVRSRMQRYLCIYVVGLNAQEGDVDDPVCETSMAGRVVIENIEEFKKNLEVYPARI